MTAPTTKTFQGQLADALLAAVKANGPAIVAAINGAEGGIEAFIAAELKTIKIANPFEQALYNVIEPSLIASLVGLEAQESGQVVYAWAVSQVQAWAVELGG